MAIEHDISGSGTTKSASKTPYQLDLTQTTKACKVLQQSIANTVEKRKTTADKRDLLYADETNVSQNSGNGALSGTPIWMILTGKKHITDRTRLKPHTIPLPHSLNAHHNLTICLITSDPQRVYKDAVADPSFPQPLRARITRVIGLDKLKARYKSFESKRQLASEHDLFLADARIWTYLPQILGKVFFHGGGKRPIPIEIGGVKVGRPKLGGVRRSTKGSEGSGAANPTSIAKQIEKALHSAVVNLSTSNTSAVKVASADMHPTYSSANIDAVVKGMTSKLIPQGWRNVRAIHIKGPSTPALPIWLANELWADERDVLSGQSEVNRKRKRDSSSHGPDQSQSRGKNESKSSVKPSKKDRVSSGQGETPRPGGTSTGKSGDRSHEMKKLKANVLQAAGAD